MKKGNKFRCDECEQKIDNPIQKQIKMILIKDVDFCSNQCQEIFESRVKDDLKENNIYKSNNDLIEEISELNNEINKLQKENNDLENNKKEYFEGYVDGISDVIKKGNICPYCEKNVIQSVHHLVPRKLGGLDIPENLIPLCNKCHDEIEIKTSILLSRNEKYDMLQLRSYILNKNFPSGD